MRLLNLTEASTQVRVESRLRSHRVGSRLFTRREEGQALFEFAVCLPVLMLIVTGMYTFGITLHNYLELTDAVAVGARLLAVERGQTTDPCKDATTAIANAAPLLASGSLTYSFSLNGNGYSGTSCTAGAANLVQGQAAEVTATYPCNLTWYGSFLPSCTLTAEATELVQ